jgi:phage terminase large subunit
MHRTPFGALASVARGAMSDASVVRWPSSRWANDPVLFAREVLGVELWSAQVEIVESIRDHRNTTVRSGHKCGKSTAIAVAALWFYCTFERARIIITAVKASQVEKVIWKEIRRLFFAARRGGFPIDGEIFEVARSGLRAPDEREIFGLTARDGEGLAGISSPNVLVLADEASGIKDQFFEVLGTSLASDGGTVRKCYISNPTRTVGEFYRSHTVNKALFHCIAISSEDTPNARGTGRIPGLAGLDWINERRTEYGEDSPQFRVRVKGEFVHDKDGKIISLNIIALAQAAWEEAPETGILQLGIDPAGDGIKGDESAISVRRGSKVLTVLAYRGKTEDEIVAAALDILATYRRPRDIKPRIALDCEGGIGTRVLEKFRAELEKDDTAFELVAVRSGKKFWGSPEYDTIRDGLWGQTQKFLQGGGAIPEDGRLAQELNAPTFTPDENQRYVATPKKVLKKELGRSPDRADAVCLSIWGFEADEARPEEPPPRKSVEVETDAELDDDLAQGGAFDPYAGAAQWHGGRR